MRQVIELFFLRKWVKTALLAAAVILGIYLLAGCAPIGYAVSAGSGWYTHERIDGIETKQLKNIEDRVRQLEIRF